MTKLGKRRKSALQEKNTDVLSFSAAVDFLKSHASKSFDESVDIAVSLGVDTKKTDQVVRGVCILPHGTGKKISVAAFVGEDKLELAKDAGADIVGSHELIEEIKNGRKIDFNVCVASPDMMPAIGKIARLLGARGLMPSPKQNTVSANIADIVMAAKKGRLAFRADKYGIVHASVGRISFSEANLFENFSEFMKSILKEKPAASKGNYVKKITISTTHGVGIFVSKNSLSV